MDNIDKLIDSFMHDPSFREMLERDLLFTPAVTLTYALERLVIVHVKLWMLEDQVRDNRLTLTKIGELKRKIDYLNGHVRPRLVEAIGEMFAKAVKERNEEIVREPNLKDYEARNNG